MQPRTGSSRKPASKGPWVWSPVSPGDTDNLFVCLSARHLNSKLVVVARAEGDDATAKMYRAGADHVVSPNMTGALWVASLLVRPSVASFLDVTSSRHRLSRHIDQVTIDAASGMAGHHPR